MADWSVIIENKVRPAQAYAILRASERTSEGTRKRWEEQGRMSLRLAAYAVCVEDGHALLARHVSSRGESTWTLPGGRVEQGEDPFDAVIREVAEETGCDAVVDRLLGVDSRTIPAAERTIPGGPDHQNVGIFYEVRITGGQLRPEPDGAIAESVWTPLPDVVRLRRSSLVDIGLALARTRPATGHVDPVPVGGLIQH